MASSQANGVRLYNAQKRTYQAVKEHGTPERREQIRSSILHEDAMPSINYEMEMHAFNMELVAGLAEIVEAQAERISALENPPVAATASAPSKKGTKKA